MTRSSQTIDRWLQWRAVKCGGEALGELRFLGSTSPFALGM